LKIAELTHEEKKHGLI